jgi:hypothetical protein
MPPQAHIDFMVTQPGSGHSVTTSEVSMPIGSSYNVPIRWVVDKIQGGALNQNSTKLPTPWSPWQNREYKPETHDQQTETMTTRI